MDKYQGSNEVEPSQGPCEMEEMEASNINNKHAVHISSCQIQSIPTNQQADELKELGLDVFDQDEFEQGMH